MDPKKPVVRVKGFQKQDPEATPAPPPAGPIKTGKPLAVGFKSPTPPPDPDPPVEEPSPVPPIQEPPEELPPAGEPPPEPMQAASSPIRSRFPQRTAAAPAETAAPPPPVEPALPSVATKPRYTPDTDPARVAKRQWWKYYLWQKSGRPPEQTPQQEAPQ